MAEKRDRRMVVWAAHLGLLGLTLASCGCLAIAAGGAAGGAALGYAYYKGAVFNKYNARFEDTFAATRAALADLRMPITKEEAQDGSGSITSRTADGDKVQISFSTETSKIPAEGTITRVGVRVGVFGDDAVSERVLGQISAHLIVPGAIAPVPASLPPAPIQPIAAATNIPQTPPPPLAPVPVTNK
jgi:hypothetical protein